MSFFLAYSLNWKNLDRCVVGTGAHATGGFDFLEAVAIEWQLL